MKIDRNMKAGTIICTTDGIIMLTDSYDEFHKGYYGTEIEIDETGFLVEIGEKILYTISDLKRGGEII